MADKNKSQNRQENPDHAKRLKNALRDNLKRRKAQNRPADTGLLDSSRDAKEQASGAASTSMARRERKLKPQSDQGSDQD